MAHPHMDGKSKSLHQTLPSQGWMTVENVPIYYTTKNLRVFFSSFIESHKFRLFHYRRRKGTGGSRCCLVCLANPADSSSFIRRYNGARWTANNGDSLSSRCVIKLASPPQLSPSKPLQCPQTYLTRKQKRTLQSLRTRKPMVAQRYLEDLQSQIVVNPEVWEELFPPAGLPQGNIGTPEDTIQRNMNVIPPKVLGKLGFRGGLKVRRDFAFDYTDLGLGDVDASDVRTPTDDDAALRAAAARRDAEDDNTAEEWDRHSSLHPYLDRGRELGTINDEYLFERKCDNPWDKGDASSLVFYTDAVYWDSLKGSFDERTADDFDVDTVEVSVTQQPKPSLLPQSSSLSPDQPVATKVPPHIPRIMRRMGWIEGQGLGKREGRVEPVRAIPRNDRSGIGSASKHTHKRKLTEASLASRKRPRAAKRGAIREQHCSNEHPRATAIDVGVFEVAGL